MILYVIFNCYFWCFLRNVFVSLVRFSFSLLDAVDTRAFFVLSDLASSVGVKGSLFYAGVFVRLLIFPSVYCYFMFYMDYHCNITFGKSVFSSRIR